MLSIFHDAIWHHYPDSKIHGANMGPAWVLSALGGSHVSPMNLAIRVDINELGIACHLLIFKSLPEWWWLTDYQTSISVRFDKDPYISFQEN